MKRQIRRGVFESNSSSQHSLCIMRRSSTYTPEEILKDIWLYDDKETGEEDCVWNLRECEMEFGRSPFRALGTFKDKWLYACASLVKDYNDEVYKELVSIAMKYVPNLKKIVPPMISDSFADKDDEENKDSTYAQRWGKTEAELIEYLAKKEALWGFEVEYWKTSKGYWRFDKPFTGYVDENILGSFLKEEGITLEEYLMNKRYVVIQDGDEYCYYRDMKKAGLINIDAIDHEYPEYEEDEF